MSGCGCGQPVIVNAPTPARVDVETLLLCDVLADGTATPVLVEPIYDTVSGERVGTRTVDPATGDPYTVTGTLQQCDPPPCTTCETIRLCAVAPVEQPTSDAAITVTAGTPGVGAPGTIMGGPFNAPLADSQAVWDGSSAVLAAGPDNQHTYIIGAVDLVPDCGELDPAGSTVLTTSLRIHNDGAGAGCGLWGRYTIWANGVDVVGEPASWLGTLGGGTGIAPGDAVTPTRTATVSNADLIAGRVYVELNVQTGADTTPDGGGCTPNDPGVGQAYTVDQFSITAEPVAVTGCLAPGGGEPVPFLRHICRNCSGQVISSTDTELDGTTPYTVAGVPGPCVTSAPCESPTTPVTSVGLCLADGTPIAVTVVRDCTGTVTSEGWINLSTGAWTAGAVPVGTVACGESRSIQVSGTFCDIDAAGEVVGLVLVEYTYDDTGAISSVRLVDAVTGGTYTPTGTVTVCPAGVEQPEQDVIQLCDVQADGTAVPMVRDYRRDENGAIVAHSDYTLNGAAYTPTGTVGLCEACPSTVEVLRLCDLNPSVTPDAEGRRCAVPFLRHLVHDCTGALVDSRDTEMDGVTAYTPVAVVDCGDGGVPAQVELIWPQTGITEDPAGTVGQDFIYTITNPDTGDTAEVRLHASRAAGGNCGAYDPAAPVFNNPTTYTLTLDAAAQEMTVFRLDLWDFDTFEGVSQLNPPPDRVEGDVTWNGGSVVTANTNNVTAYLYWDNPPATITYRYGNTGGGTACTAVAFQGTTLKPEGCCGCSPAAECLHCETVQLCDTVSSGPTGVIAGAVGDNSGTADNGITWTANGDADPVEATKSTSDGLWWSIQTYPSTSTGPITFTLDAPAVVEFSVVMRHVANETNTTQLPAGLKVVNLPAGYSYDAATGVLAVDSTLPATTQPNSPECASYVAPSAENSPRFLTPGPVTSFTADYTGQAVPVCGEIGPFRVGAITLNPPPKLFLRTVCRSCDGSVDTVTDTRLDAVTPYTPLGTVGVCQPADCETEQLCDVQEDVTAVLPSVGVPTEAWQDLPNGVRWQRRGADGAAPGGWYAADASTPERFDFDRPVSLTYTVRFSGPTAAPLRIPAGWYLDSINTGQHAWNATTRVISPTASATQAGLSTFRIEAQTAQTMTAPVVVGTQPSGQSSQYGQITVTADQTTLFLRTLCRDSAGTVTTTDTLLDGVTPYTVLGTAGRCTQTPPPPCWDCETLVLCDDGADDPATITGTGASTGTLSNGVTWTSRGSSSAASANYDGGAGEGSWWPAIYSFPNATIGNATWSFDKPSYVEFSVYMRWVNYTGTSDPTNPNPRNATRLPANVEVVSLPDGYSYDPVNNLVWVDESRADPNNEACADLTAPKIAESARFRTLDPVSSVTTRYLGVRVANCGVFGSQRVGAFSVDPTGTFLRTICRDCDGMVTSITDTALDGQTPYTVVGTAKTCAQNIDGSVSIVGPVEVTPAEDCCQPTQVCIQQDAEQQIHFITNEEHLEDNSVDPVWKWSLTPDDPAATWYDMYEGAHSWASAWTVTDTNTERPAWWLSAHPNGNSAQSSPPLPGEGPSLVNTHWYARSFFDLPAGADPGSIQVQVTVLNADQFARAFRLNNGPWQPLPASACFRVENGCVAYTFGPGSIPGAQAGRNYLYLDVEETVGGASGLMAHLIVTYQIGRPEQRSWTRMVCCDGTVYHLDESGARQDSLPEGWSVAPCGINSHPIALCDDAGTFLRHVTYTSDGQVLISDTDVLGGPYSPTGTVRSCT